jgi:surface protein
VGGGSSESLNLTQISSENSGEEVVSTENVASEETDSTDASDGFAGAENTDGETCTVDECVFQQDDNQLITPDTLDTSSSVGLEEATASSDSLTTTEKTSNEVRSAETQNDALSTLESAESSATFTADWTQCGTCEWQIDDDGKLTVRPLGGTDAGMLADWEESGDVPWYSQRSSITSVVVEKGVSAQTCLYMFSGCSNLTSVDISGFNTSAVTYMNKMFKDCSKLITLDLSDLDTSSATSMNAMFSGCSNLTSVNLSGLNTSKVTSMSCMFYECTSLTSVNLSGLDTSKVKDMALMFVDCSNLAFVDLSGLGTSSVTSMDGMFEGCSKLATLTLPAGADFSNASLRTTKWSDSLGNNYADTKVMLAANVSRETGAETYYAGQFATEGWTQSNTCEWQIDSAGKLTVRPLGGTGTGTLQDWSGYTSVPWYTQRSSITSVVIEQGVSAQTCYDMFYYCRSLTSVDLTGLDTSAVTDMGYMFSGCSALTAVNLTGLDTSAVTNMNAMFSACSSLEYIGLSGLDMSAITDMESMFYGCTSLDYIDLSGLVASETTDMRSMFYKCATPRSLTLPAGVDFSGTSLKDNAWIDTLGNAYASTSEMFSANVARKSGEETYTRVLLPDGWEQCGTCEWQIDKAGKLTIRPANGAKTGTLASWTYSYLLAPWTWDNANILIKSVVIEDGVNAQTCGGMFLCCGNITSVDLTGLNAASEIENMFLGCSEIKTIILPAGANYSGSNLHDIAWKDSNGNIYDTTSEMLAANAARTSGSMEYSSLASEGWLPCGTCEWQIDKAGKLTIRPLDGATTGKLGNWGEAAFWKYVDTYLYTNPWVHEYPSIKSVVVEQGVIAQTCFGMFAEAANLISVDLSGLDTSAVTNMSEMFRLCRSLTTIYVSSDFSTTYVADSLSRMFYECNSLVGGAGTSYDASHANVTYAKIDGGESSPGYFTLKQQKLLEGDINNNGVVNVVDALITYDIACGLYTDMEDYASMKTRADFNGDGIVDSSDAFAILYISNNS